MEQTAITISPEVADPDVRDRALQALPTIENDEIRHLILELIDVIDRRCSAKWMKNKYKLTFTEFKILSMLFSGMSAKQISEETGSKITTIRVHIRNIYNKVGVNSMMGLVSKLLKGS